MSDELEQDRSSETAATIRDTTTTRLALTERLVAGAQVLLGGPTPASPAAMDTVVSPSWLSAYYPGVTGIWYVTGRPGGAMVVDAASPTGSIGTSQGADLATIPSAHDTLLRARDTGRAMLTGALTLPTVKRATGLGTFPVFALVMPVYSTPATPTTVDARRSALRGWVAGVIRGDAFLAGLFADAPRYRQVEVFEGRTVERGSLLAMRPPRLRAGDSAAVTFADSRNLHLNLYGTTWTVRYRAIRDAEDSQISTARTLLLVMGLGVSLLVFLLARVMRRSELRALTSVDEATSSLAQNEERFRALVHESTEMTFVVEPDGHLKYASRAVEIVLGYSPIDMIGVDMFTLIHPDDRVRTFGGFEDFHELDEILEQPVELRVRRADGEWLWVEAVSTNLLDNPAIAGIVVNVRDINERKRVEAALQEAQVRFRNAFEEAPIGMALVSPGGVLIRVNRAFREMLGYSEDDLLGKEVAELTDPDDRQVTAVAMQRLLKGEISRHRLEKRFLHADGSMVWTAVTASLVRDPDGEPLYMIAQIEDVTQRKAIGARLAHQAIHDPLTGLPNRVLFMDRLVQSLIASERRRSRVVVLFLDLDRFKFVNDSLGHAAGDRLLVAIAHRLRSTLRPNDTVARFGDDEFTVLCENVPDQATAFEIVERMASTFARPVALPEGETFVTASIGIAISRPGIDTADTLVRDADAAMYRAKDKGRNCWELSDEGARAATVDFLKTGNDLHRALQRGELRVHYQPIIKLETGRISGFEALLRWMHPDRGLLAPEEFIALAEETGLVLPIGRWALEESCRQLTRWQGLYEGRTPLTMAVNLSPRQLAEPSLPDEVARILDRTGVSPGALWLEITESTLARDAESAISALRALRSLGLHLAVDDFGTGYSSMSYLRRFPVEALKVDRSFVDRLGRDPEDTAIVTAVVSLAHALGLVAIAEGVETPIQLAELRTLGCEFAQGFFFGPPQPVDALGDHPVYDLHTWDALRIVDGH